MGIGAAATVWVRRRVDRLARQVRPGQLAGGLATVVDHSARSTAGRVRQSVDSGRRAARRRAVELHHDMGIRDPSR
jgi:hypothetical protein